MPRKRWIDKKDAQTFQLLYRSQNDPLLNDDSAGERALFQVSGTSSSSDPRPHKNGLRLADLEDDLDFDGMRENEGEAAEYGVFFDDTDYDYMQHLRDIEDGSDEAHFMDAAPVRVQEKGKGKTKIMKLEDALRETTIEKQDPQSAYDGLSTFSRSTRPRTYQDQQDVPDEIAGFQPDMDPRLREVLEALEDEAYVDEKDEEDVFGALAKEGQNGELELSEFEAMYEEGDDGWESDATEKATAQPRELKRPPIDQGALLSEMPDPHKAPIETDAATAAGEDGDWMRDFAKFKGDVTKGPAKAAESIIAASAVHDRSPTLYTLNGTPSRQKKRKGALTNPSAYSMTSSSLARTKGQQLLDARFDQIEKMYALEEADEFDDEDGDMSLASGTSRQSKMSGISTSSFAEEGATRGDLEGMMDGFLDGWSNGNPNVNKRKGAKGKRGKNGNEIFGLRQLDEVRAELGPARIRRSQKA